MKGLDRNGYTAAAVRAALLASPRTIDFRYERYDKTNAYLDSFSGVVSGSVDHAGFADIKRSGRFYIKDSSEVNWNSDRIKPIMRVRMPDGGWAEFPLGLFLMSSPSLASQASATKFRSVDAYDQTFILQSDKVATRYTVNTGTLITGEIVSLLNGAGITLRNVVSSTATLATTRDWDPGTPKIVIINALLAAINYQALWFDSDGYAVAAPYISPSSLGPAEKYRDDAYSLLRAEGTKSLDLFGVPNKWVAYISDPERPSLISTYTNTNPSSPTSTVSRGFTIVDYREANDVPDQATLDAYVARIAYEASQVYETVEVSTGLMPHHEHLDVLELGYSRLGVEPGNYQETNWSMDLVVGGSMKHSLRRLVTI